MTIEKYLADTIAKLRGPRQLLGAELGEFHRAATGACLPTSQQPDGKFSHLATARAVGIWTAAVEWTCSQLDPLARRAPAPADEQDPRIAAFYKLRDIAERDGDPESASIAASAIAALAHQAAPAQPATDEKHLPGWERGIATVTLSGHQLRMALDLINPDGLEDRDQLDDELTFGIVQHKDDDGNASTGMCCWNDDTDGVLPLDGEYEAGAAPAQPSAATPKPTAQDVVAALSDEKIIAILHYFAVDTYPSKRGFPEIQVSATNVPTIRKVVEKCMALAIEQAGGSTSKETDLSKRLRDTSRHTGETIGRLLLDAADEIERYYGGMVAWKRTAEAKDAAFVRPIEQAGAQPVAQADQEGQQ